MNRIKLIALTFVMVALAILYSNHARSVEASNA
jgi:hypothetical protein